MPRMDKLSRYNTGVIQIGNVIRVVYHTTMIVEVGHDTITLDCGGWDTVTTRRKMNQAAKEFGLPYTVYREDGQTYARSTLDGEARKLNAGGPVTLPRRVVAER